MTWTRSLRWLSVGIVICFVVGAFVLLVVSGTLIASGELWDVDRASNVEVGTGQQQVITNIEVLNPNEPVEIYVGDIVAAGANLDANASSYWISGKEERKSSEVYLKNPNSSNATIVVSASAISSSGRFDLYLDNIDTTNVSRYHQNGSKINRDISYTAEQGGQKSIIRFNIFSPASIEFEQGTYNKSTQSISYNISQDRNSKLNFSVTVWEENRDGNIGKKIKTVEHPSKNISIRNTGIEGKTELIIGLHSPSNEHGLRAIYNLDNTSINVTVPARVVSGPFYYTESKNRYDSDRTLLFEFNTNISDSQGYIQTKFSNKDSVRVRLDNHTNKYDINGNFLYIHPVANSSKYTYSISPKIDKIVVDNITSTTSNVRFKSTYSSPTRVDRIFSNNSNYSINRGSNIGLYLKSQDIYTISKLGGDIVRQIKSTNSVHTHKISTDGLSSDYYSLDSGSGINNTIIKLLNPTVSLGVTDTVAGSHMPIDIAATGTRRTAVLSVSNSNSTEIYREDLILDNSSNTSRLIPVSQSGTYEVEVDDLDTRTTTTRDVNVIEDRSPTVNVNENNSVDSGSHFTLLLNSTYDRSLMNLNTPNDSTTSLELTTTDRGPTSVTLNTYASPASPEFVTAGSGVSVESVTGDTGSLSPGTYDLTLRSEYGAEVANDTAGITVDSRSTGELTAYTTSAVPPDGFENASEVREAIADGTLAPATTATATDTVVYAVNATGLTGLPETANGSLERGTDLDRLDGLSFGVAPTEGDDSADGDALGRMPAESAVHLDRNGLFVVADGERAFGTETAPDPGETFEAAFRIDDDRLRRTAADDRHRVTTELAYAAGSTDESTDADDGDSTEAGSSTGSGGSGSIGSVGGSGSTDDGSSTGSGSTGGGSTGESSGSGGAAGPAGSAGAGNVTNAGNSGSTKGSPGSDAGPSGPGPGVGIRVAPGETAVPPSVGAPELPGTDGPERGSDDPATEGLRSSDGRSDEGAGSGGDGATSTKSADSAESAEASVVSDQSGGGTDASDLGYDDAPIRSTAYDLPGFGAAASLAALAGASLLARRRGP